MWIFVVEALLALGLLVFIVWWTMAPVKKREDSQRRPEALPADKKEPPETG